MADFLTRAVTADDASVVTELLNAIDAAAGARAGWVDGEVRALIVGWVSTAPADSRLLLDTDGTAVALAAFALPEHGIRASLFGGVHPDWRGRGIGRDLLRWQIERVSAVRDVRAPGVDWEVEAGANVGDPSAQRLFERFGMSPERYFLEMHMELDEDGPVVRDVPAGLRVEAYRPEQFEALFAAHMEVWGDHWGFQPENRDRWKTRVIDSEVFRPDLTRIAFDGDEIVAYVLADDGVDGEVYLAYVGTKREWRQRGVASSMINAVLGASAKAGKQSAILGVDSDSLTGAVGVYEKVGFRTTTRYVDYRKALPA